jgi:acyl carrier protein
MEVDTRVDHGTAAPTAGSAELRLDIQSTISGFVEDALDIQGIAPFADLFELGADSIAASKVFNRIQQHFSLDLDLEAAFSCLNVAGLAALVEGQILAMLDGMTDDELERLVGCEGPDPG